MNELKKGFVQELCSTVWWVVLLRGITVFLLGLLLIPTIGHARIRESRPDPDEVATKVGVGLYVINISKIDNIEQVFTIDFAVRMTWRDPRLVRKPGVYALSEVWHPDVVIINQHGVNKLLDDVVTVDSSGNVRYGQRLWGDLALKLAVRDFPFDTHTLPIKIVSVSYGPGEIEFVEDEYGVSRAEELSIAGWSVEEEINFRTGGYYVAGRGNELADIDFVLKAKRHAGFYIWRVVIPLLLIIFMSWAVFFLDPRELESQITISVTSILTVIALQFTFVGILPKVSYLTRLDRFILGATILIFLALIESITTSALTLGGKHSLARRFDNWSRIVFPITLILFVIFSFWL
ncbi:hypothetical protein KA005_64190 [bacterium]|nr:hypothetical protein [bacterium]